MTETGDCTERRQDIGRTISEAMKKLSDVDWSRESPGITEAQAELDETTTRYCEGKASKAEVKVAYRSWIETLRDRGGLFT